MWGETVECFARNHCPSLHKGQFLEDLERAKVGQRWPRNHVGIPVCFACRLTSPRGTSLVAQAVKRLPTMRETGVHSLGWEDLLKKEMATHSSILAWKIPWMEEPGWLESMGSQRVRHDWATSLSLSPLHESILLTPANVILQIRNPVASVSCLKTSNGLQIRPPATFV